MSLISESEISMLLDTYMYLNYYGADDGQEISGILEELSVHPDYMENGKFHEEYTILEQAAREYPEFGEIKISCQSWNKGYDSGTAACAFEDRSGTHYIVFRGTGDGEWLDNAGGLSDTSTIQQERALQYFNDVSGEKGFTAKDRIVVTGHSKGGNKAQYITMEEKRGLVDRCYSIDGQGFSEKAIRRWESTYSGEEYVRRRSKIHGIAGENDFVHVLGYSIIPKEQRKYIITPVESWQVAGYHDIKHFYAQMNAGGEVEFTGIRNPYTWERGKLADYVARTSGVIMRMPDEQKSGCAAALMQIIELGGSRKKGLNGEMAGWKDIFYLMSHGIPMAAFTAMFTEEGKGLFIGEQGKTAVFRIEIASFEGICYNLESMHREVTKILEEICLILPGLRDCIKGNDRIHHMLEKEMDELRECADKLGEVNCLLRDIVGEYLQCDTV